MKMTFNWYRHKSRFVVRMNVLMVTISTLLCSVLIACDSTDLPARHHSVDRPITIWHALRGDDQIHLSEDLARYERETGERVTSLQLPHSAFANKVQVAIPRGNGPDLFIGAHDRVGDWAEAKLIEPVSFWVSGAQYHRYESNAVKAFTYRSQLYGLPLSCKALALFYNPKLVSAPETVEELVKNSARAKAKRDVESSHRQQTRQTLWGLAYPEVDSLYFHAPWLHAFGGLAIDQGNPQLNSEPMKRSAALVKRLRHDGLIPPELDGALSSTLFRSGRLAYLINGPWFIAELGDLPSSEWAVAPLPTLAETGQPLKPYLSVEGVMVSSRAKDLKRAWRLAEYLASRQMAEHRLKRGELIARVDVERSSLDDSRSVFQAQVSSSVPLSNEPVMKTLWTPAKRALGQAIIYNAPIRSSFDEAQQAVERALNGGQVDDQ